MTEMGRPREGQSGLVVRDRQQFFIIHVVVSLFAHGLVQFNGNHSRPVDVYFPQNGLLCFAVNVAGE